MQPKHGLFWHLGGLARGFVGMTLRLAAVFGVIGAGYAIYQWFGRDWFYVFIFAVIAARLDVELRLIEHATFDDDGAERPPEDEPPHPFRKR